MTEILDMDKEEDVEKFKESCEQEFSSELLEIETRAHSFKKLFDTVFMNITQHKNTYVFKSRVKSYEGLLHKLVRKRIEQYKSGNEISYKPAEITDAYALRYVTLFQDDIVDVVNNVLTYFDSSSGGQEEVLIDEVTVYTNRPQNDPLSICQKVIDICSEKLTSEKVSAIQKERVKIEPPSSKKSGYSSVHIIIVLSRTFMDKQDNRVQEKLSAEMQIRDIFEEGWGEIQHYLMYKDKDNLLPDDLPTNNHHWEPHLNALKTFADGCSQHASIILKNSVAIPKEIVVKAISTDGVSLSENKVNRETLLSLITDLELRKLVSQIYEQISEIKDLKFKHGINRIFLKKIDDAKTSFQNFFNSFNKFENEIDPKDKNTIRFHMDLEYAFILVNSALDDDLREAEGIYRKHIEKHSDNPIIVYRLANVLYKRTNETIEKPTIDTLDEIVKLLETALNLLSEEDKKEDSRKVWLPLSISNLLGHIHWAYVEFGHCDNEEEKLTRLNDAVEITWSGYKESKEKIVTSEHDFYDVFFHGKQISIADNLYYRCCLEFVYAGDINKSLDSERSQHWDQRCVNESLELLKTYSEKEFVDLESIYALDTVMIALALMNNKNDALLLAEEIIKRLFEKYIKNIDKGSRQTPTQLLHSIKDHGDTECLKRSIAVSAWSIR